VINLSKFLYGFFVCLLVSNLFLGSQKGGHERVCRERVFSFGR
jgi:hypothetical protein